MPEIAANVLKKPIIKPVSPAYAYISTTIVPYGMRNALWGSWLGEHLNPELPVHF